jgi:predicted glycoside hydrolase/deacetylase ChbG (UPF0249 family)
MTRKLAFRFFSAQTHPFDQPFLQLAIVSILAGCREKDLDVTLMLKAEKSVKNILNEAISLLVSLVQIFKQYREGCFYPLVRPSRISADDWGLSRGVNDGIFDLAQRGVVKRVSIMAGTSSLTYKLSELKAIPGIELGLHFNLTLGKSRSKTLLSWLLSFGQKRKALIEAARAELMSQIAEVKALGVNLVYLDGHHHMHLLPGFLQNAADILKREGIKTVRLPYDKALWFTGKFPILVLTLFARKRVGQMGFLSGEFLYPLKNHFLDPARLRAKIAINPDAEIIVHPATDADVHEIDSYNEGRVFEYRALRTISTEWQ